MSRFHDIIKKWRISVERVSAYRLKKLNGTYGFGAKQIFQVMGFGHGIDEDELCQDLEAIGFQTKKKDGVVHFIYSRSKAVSGAPRLQPTTPPHQTAPSRLETATESISRLDNAVISDLKGKAMENELKIEEGIPIPPARHKRGLKYNEALKKMKIKSSVFLKKSQAPTFMRYAKKMGYQMTGRQMDGGIRVWRIK